VSMAERVGHCVLLAAELGPGELAAVLAKFGLRAVCLPINAEIPGSYWGESEAGLIRDQLFMRLDTPVHSVLHEACHWIVMDPVRRPEVDTDASDSILEENATCYLQILLADAIPVFGRERALADMDRWGYSFRLGSARAWFEQDADDARAFLLAHQLIDAADQVQYRIRTNSRGAS